MTPIQIFVLDQAIARLSEPGVWIPDNPSGDPDHDCVITAIQRVYANLFIQEDVLDLISTVSKVYRSELPDWNDQQTSVAPILATLHEARNLLIKESANANDRTQSDRLPSQP